MGVKDAQYNEIEKPIKQDVHKITRLQKVYDLSTIWKELSYNFGNLDNCKHLDIDSLYRVFIPLVEHTTNDFEYWKCLQHFMSHFNNGHTTLTGVPQHLVRYLAYPMLQTSYSNGFVIVENYGTRYSDKLSVGDTVVSISGMPVIKYFEKYHMPYVCSSNEGYKIHRAMFNFSNKCNLSWGDKTIHLGIKNGDIMKKVIIKYDYYLDANKTHLRDKWFFNDYINRYVNGFECDTANRVAYIDLHACNEAFQNTFETKYPQIMKCNRLIIDLSNNRGGNSKYTDAVLGYLIGHDTLKNPITLCRYNNSWWRSYNMFVSNSEKEKHITLQTHGQYYLNHTFQCFNNSFKTKLSEISMQENYIAKAKRFQGEIYVIIGKNTVSAAEHFVIRLSQNTRVKFLGEKTAGANAQPLYIQLPSGIRCMINTAKVYDFDNNDVSQGFIPDSEIDLSSLYKVGSRKKLLKSLLSVIDSIVSQPAKK